MKIHYCPKCGGSQFVVETTLGASREDRSGALREDQHDLWPPAMALWCAPCGRVAAVVRQSKDSRLVVVGGRIDDATVTEVSK